MSVEREYSSPYRVCRDIANGSCGSDDPGAGKENIDWRFREGRKQAERDEEITDSTRASRGKLVLYDAAIRAVACRASRDQAWAVDDGGTSI